MARIHWLKFAAGAAVLLTAALAVCAWRGAFAHGVLELRDDQTGRVYARYPISVGDEFSVTFVHSVNKSDVTDIYQIRPDGIYAVASRYSAFGAGMPTSLEPGWTLTQYEDCMVLSGLDQTMQRLCYVVGTVYDHRLTIGETEINLRALCGKNRSVLFVYRK